MTVSSSSRSHRPFRWSVLAILTLGVLWLLLAPQPAQATQACEWDDDGYEICPTNPEPVTAQPACDWECQEWKGQQREIRARQRAERKRQKAERKRQQAIYDQQMREWKKERAQIARANALIDSSNAFVVKAIEASAAGRHEEEIRYLRAALKVNPNSPHSRLNLMRRLSLYGYKLATAKIYSFDHSNLAELQNWLGEVRALDTADLTSSADYAGAKQNADLFAQAVAMLQESSLRADQARRIAAREQAAADARRRGEAARRTASGTAPTSDPIVIQRNPGARTAEAAAVAREARPEGGVHAPTAAESAQRLRERLATGRVFDGGGGPTDAKADVPAAVPTPISSRVISSADFLRYNREPAFRDANAKVEKARVARVAADRVRTDLANQTAHSEGGLAPPPARQDVDAAERAAAQALAVQRAAELAREKVIEKIEYGEPIEEPEQ